MLFLGKAVLRGGGAGRGPERRGGKNRREVIRRHLAQRSQLRHLKSEVGIGRALVESAGVRGGAWQLQACFYGDKTRDGRPWGQKRHREQHLAGWAPGRSLLLASYVV